jgi:hypothetical protein
MNLPTIIQMKNIIRLGLATLGMGAILGATLSSQAETPDIFTKHDLPIPGAYFAKHRSQKSATVAISKSGQGV